MNRPEHRAFTLIELLAVLVVIGVLAILLFQSTKGLMRSGLNAKSIVNLRNIGAAWASYIPDNDGRLPPMKSGVGPWYEDYWTKPLANYLGFATPPQGHLDALVGTIAFCPLNRGKLYHRKECSALSYLPNALIGGAFNGDGSLADSLQRWPSNTVAVALTLGALNNPSKQLLFAEAREDLVRTYLDAENPEPYLARHYKGGGNVLFADGSIRHVVPESNAQVISLILGNAD